MYETPPVAFFTEAIDKDGKFIIIVHVAKTNIRHTKKKGDIMIYKVVPAAMVVEGSTTSVADYFERVINRESQYGWQFYSMETATAQENSGCTLTGPTVKNTTTYLLIFCKPESGDVAGVPAAAPAPRQAAVPRASTSSAPVVVSKPGASAEAQWTCKNCGTSNKAVHGMCKKCGAYRNA